MQPRYEIWRTENMQVELRRSATGDDQEDGQDECRGARTFFFLLMGRCRRSAAQLPNGMGY